MATRSECAGASTHLLSPRIAALHGELERGDAALERFWRQVEAGGTPLVERIEGDDGHVLVTLLWRGDDATRNVVAETPFDTGDPDECQMTRLPGTDVWYRTFRAPGDLRFSYSVAPNDPLIPWSQSVPWARRVSTWRADPLNRGRRLVFPADEEAPPGDSRGAAWEMSTVELPAARRDRWSEPRPGVPTGRVEQHRLRSEGLLPCDWLAPPLRDTRRVWVYTPAGDAPAGEPYPLLLLLDGYDYLHYVRVPTILDNLRADGLVPPLLAVLLDTPNRLRGRELNGSERFADALAQEVVPWVRRHYAVTDAPVRCVVGGLSLGGLGAAFAASRHPEVFGAVLSQSGAFWLARAGDNEDSEPEWFARWVAAAERRPLRFVLDAGRLETWVPRSEAPSLLTANRHLRTVLQAKGYPVRYAEAAGGHAFFSWQLTLAEGLMSLLGSG